MCKNHLEGVYKMRICGIDPRDSDSVDLGGVQYRDQCKDQLEPDARELSD